jgi:hypothetical protein
MPGKIALPDDEQTGYNLPNFRSVMMDNNGLPTTGFDKVQYFDQVKLNNFIGSSRLEGIDVICTNETMDEIIARYQNPDRILPASAMKKG